MENFDGKCIGDLDLETTSETKMSLRVFFSTLKFLNQPALKKLVLDQFKLIFHPAPSKPIVLAFS